MAFQDFFGDAEFSVAVPDKLPLLGLAALDGGGFDEQLQALAGQALLFALEINAAQSEIKSEATFNEQDRQKQPADDERGVAPQSHLQFVQYISLHSGLSLSNKPDVQSKRFSAGWKQPKMLNIEHARNSALDVQRSAFDVSLVLLLLALLVLPARAQTAFHGETSCSSSGCHGGAGEKRDQCIRFNKLDVHTRSYATLTMARSARIADVLKLGDPAQSARCTICHAPFQTIATNAALQKILDPTAGVSCESCHGAADKWLLSHTRSDFTHQDRVNAGMRDLQNLYVRANTCVACHQNVDADILRAGHPELIFELDGQSVAEPKHWREATNWSGPQTWLVGQAVALREMIWKLNGQNKFYTNNLDRIGDLYLLLGNISQVDTNWPPLPEISGPLFFGSRYLKAADQLAMSVASANWSPATTRKCLELLAGSSSFFRATGVTREQQARTAEPLVLGLDRLVAGLNDAALAKRLDAPLNQLFKDAQSLPDFDPTKFANDLEMFQKKLGT